MRRAVFPKEGTRDKVEGHPNATQSRGAEGSSQRESGTGGTPPQVGELVDRGMEVLPLVH